MVSISIVESHASLQLRYVFYGDEGIELIGDESPGPRLRSSKGLKLPSMGSTIMGCPSRIGIACMFCWWVSVTKVGHSCYCWFLDQL